MTESEMLEHRTEYEGQIVAEGLVLGKYLGGSEHCGVFLAEWEGPGPRRAAIKIIPVEEVDAETQLAQWNTAAQFVHPHLVRILKAGWCELGGREHCYAMMEFAEEDLSQILPQRALTQEETRDVLKPVLRALAFLHARGFVHGRLKPSNLMAVEEQIKLSSDGIISAGAKHGGRSGRSVYDAPETATGEISPAADVWSLGMTLVEILTQRLPVVSETEAEAPVLPEGMASPFAEIAQHCLRRDPRRRWTIAEITTRLEAPVSTPVKAVAPPPSPARPKRRYLVPVAIAAAVVLALLGVPRLFKSKAKVAAPRTARQASGVRTNAPQKPQSVPTNPPVGTGAGEAQKSGEAKQQSSPAPAAKELKLPAGNVVRGEVLRQVIPEASQQVRATIRGTIRVAVRVSTDATGSVVAAALDAPGPSRYFANLALEAARQWEFSPAKVDGRPVPSEWILRFDFDSTQTTAIPKPVKP
jgi:TonB family protein